MEKVEYLSKQLVFYIHLVAIDEEFCEYDGHSKYSNEMRGKKIMLYLIQLYVSL